MGKSKNKPDDFIWRVTKNEEGGIDLAFGPKLSEAGFDDNSKIHLVGKALIQIGTQLMGSSVRDDDDDEWDED